jgi:Arc/MetJ-type ribon-helix-helix transcriptional regulator
MGQTKKKAVFTAEPTQLEQIEAVVRAGKYRSASEFLREAIDEKLRRLRQERLEAQVASYCAEGYGDEDRDLVEFQAFDRDAE